MRATVGGFLLLFVFLRAIQIVGLPTGVIGLLVGGLQACALGEVDQAGDILVKAFDVVHTGGGTIENHGWGYAEPVFLVSAHSSFEGFRMSEFLEVLHDSDLVDGLLKLGEEVSLKLIIVVGFGVLLVPLLGPGGGVIFKEN